MLKKQLIKKKKKNNLEIHFEKTLQSEKPQIPALSLNTTIRVAFFSLFYNGYLPAHDRETKKRKAGSGNSPS